MTGAAAFKLAANGAVFNQFDGQGFLPPIPCLVAEDILSLYPRRQGSIWKRPGQRRWMQWTSALDDGQLLGVMSDEGRGLFRGLYWGSETRHGVLDIDKNSKYHNALELQELAAKFAAVGIPLVPYQSSDSGGWHLYYFFADWSPSSDVEKTIKAFLKAHGYTIAGGTLEVFPSGNALRLPMQSGFAWLDAQGEKQIAREELTQGQALALFFNDIEENKRNWSEAKNRIESQLSDFACAGVAGTGETAQGAEEPELDAGFDKLYLKGIDWERYRKGQEYWQNGLTEPSQRHDAILAIGHYLWYGDEAAGLSPLPYQKNSKRRFELISRWLQEKHNGLSDDVKNGRWGEVKADIDRAVSWSREPSQKRPEYEPYPLTERLLDRLAHFYNKTGKLLTVEELETANQERESRAREKIKAAVKTCQEYGYQISRNQIAELAGVSKNTVGRHRDLWVFLKTGSGVLVAGGFGGSWQPSEDLGISDPVFSESEYSSVSPSEDFSSELAPIDSMVVDSLPFDISGATANNSTATRFDALPPPPLLPSLATGSTTRFCVSGELVCFLNGLAPSTAAPPLGPLHLPQTKIFSIGSSGRQSNRNWDSLHLDTS